MDRRTFIGSVAGGLLAVPLSNAQSARIYRVGVVLAGGPYYHAVEGLRDGLKEVGLTEGQDYVFDVRDTKGDLKAAEEAARSLEEEKVDLIFSVPTSVSLAAKRATTKIPIVFFAGSDPVESGLVSSFAKPGDRITGVYSLSQELTGKRLEMLKQIAPRIQKVAVFYNPANPVVADSVKSARDAARQLGIVLIEREVRSSDELQGGLRALTNAAADAMFLVTDATIESHASLIVEAGKIKKLPTMFYDRSLVAEGGLASCDASIGCLCSSGLSLRDWEVQPTPNLSGAQPNEHSQECPTHVRPSTRNGSRRP